MTQFEEFITALPEWDGKNRVAELEARIKATITFSSENKEVEHIDIVRLIKECCCRDNSDRICTLTFYGVPGVNKRAFVRWLLPFSRLYKKTQFHNNRTGLIANDISIFEIKKLPRYVPTRWTNDIYLEIIELDCSYTDIDIKQLYAQILKNK